MNPVFPQLSSLWRAEKLQLVEDLWDEIAATPAALPVLDWQKQQLARPSQSRISAKFSH